MKPFIFIALIFLSLSLRAQYNGEYYVTYAWSATNPYVSDVRMPKIDSGRITKFKVGQPLSVSFPERAQDKFIILIYPWSEGIKTLWYNGIRTGTLPGQEFRSFMVGKNMCVVSRTELPFDYTIPITIQ